MNRSGKIETLRLFLDSVYPHTSCFLNAGNDYEFLFAVILSAQSQDKTVNSVTPALFERYRSLSDFAGADYAELLGIIRPIGLGPSKAGNIIALAKRLISDYGGKVPHDRHELEKLPGVGHKTAGVFLGERGSLPVIPVDTHIRRICLRLGIASPKATPSQIEKILESGYKGADMMNFHRQLITFGRSICLASDKRKCGSCPLAFCSDRLEKPQEK